MGLLIRDNYPDMLAFDYDLGVLIIGNDERRKSMNKMTEGGVKGKEDYFLHNIMREDIATNESGIYRDKILKDMPETENGYLKVKQIL